MTTMQCVCGHSVEQHDLINEGIGCIEFCGDGFCTCTKYECRESVMIEVSGDDVRGEEAKEQLPTTMQRLQRARENAENNIARQQEKLTRINSAIAALSANEGHEATVDAVLTALRW